MKREFLSDKALENLRIADREYRRKWRKNNPKLNVEKVLEYRKKHPERRKANDMVYQALKLGTLKKDKCRDCEKLDVQAHHPNYSEPLKIIWLCPSHHKLEDLKLVDKS